jgi:hypothetical protein
VLNTCRGSRLSPPRELRGTNAIFASTFLASTGSPAVAGSHVAVSLAALGLTAVGRRVIEGFHDPLLGDVVLAIETAGVGA